MIFATGRAAAVTCAALMVVNSSFFTFTATSDAIGPEPASEYEHIYAVHGPLLRSGLRAAPNELLPVPVPGGQGIPGVAGPMGPKGDKGDKGASAAPFEVTVVSTETLQPFGIGDRSMVTVSCPEGHVALGGGASVDDKLPISLKSSEPVLTGSTPTGWSALYFTLSTTRAFAQETFVICAPES